MSRRPIAALEKQPSAWRGQFHAGDGWAAYRGHAGENQLHSHTATQLVFAPEGATLRTADAERISGTALIARPGTRHALLPAHDVLLIFLEPQSALAAFVDGASPPEAVSRLSDEVAALVDLDAPLPLCAIRLAARVDRGRVDDPRLQRALAFLCDTPGARPIARAAASAGLSTPRLRALAQSQLGTPLAGWVAWRRLRRAGDAMSAGATLAEAAADAGFADQAHLSRAMRKVFGISPGMAQAVLSTAQAKRPRR